MKVTLSLDQEIHEKSKEYAKKTGRTLSGFVSLCIAQELKKRQEDVSE